MQIITFPWESYFIKLNFFVDNLYQILFFLFKHQNKPIYVSDSVILINHCNHCIY